MPNSFSMFLGTAIIVGVGLLVYGAARVIGFPWPVAAALSVWLTPLIMYAFISAVDEWGR